MADNARLLMRTGTILFALSLLNGFLVHIVSLRHQALSAHLIGLIGAVFLISVGCLWPRLDQSPRMSRLGAVLAVYGFAGGWLINFQAALTGIFGVFPVSVSASQSTETSDFIVSIGLLSVALALLAFSAILFHGIGRRGLSS